MKRRLGYGSVIVFAALLGCGSGGTAAATGPVAPSGPLAGPFTEATVTAAVNLLASHGIATVADESSTAPQVPVTGANGMMFTLAQVRGMALGAADGGGIVGSALDAAIAMPSGAPSFSYLLASWIKLAPTPASKTIGTLMGTQDWTQAPKIAFPTIALPLFVADVIAALPPATAATGALDPAGAGLVPRGLASAPCSTASNFIQGVINSVFSALQITAPTGTGVVATVGGWLAGIWNGAVTLAQLATQELISAITAPVLGAIKTAAGTALVISQVVGYVTPWSVKVTPDPASVTAGGGGTVAATVDTGTGGGTYPPAVQDCADTLGVTLPALTAAKADATWALASPISATGSTSVTLDASGANSIGFTSSSSSSEGGGCTGAAPKPPELGTAAITVTRPGIDGLKTLVTTMITNGFGVAGSIVAPTIQAILGPMVDSVVAQLAPLAEVSGTGYVWVTAPPPAPSASCTQDTKETACIFGKWVVVSLTSQALTGGAGITWTLSPDGTCVVDYNGSAPLVVVGGGDFQYAGSATYSTTLPADPQGSTGSYVATPTSQGVTATHYDPNTKQDVTTTVTETAHSTTWTCKGDSLTLDVDADGYPFVYTLSRVGE